LAHVLEMLGLHEEALVQYDELDALFSQFVVNGITGESINWLGDFQKPLEQWHGLKLNNSSVLSDSPSLLELRAYLFSKQAQMLLRANKVWEVSCYRCWTLQDVVICVFVTDGVKMFAISPFDHQRINRVRN
jgi:hypothetical protein